MLDVRDEATLVAIADEICTSGRWYQDPMGRWINFSPTAGTATISSAKAKDLGSCFIDQGLIRVEDRRGPLTEYQLVPYKYMIGSLPQTRPELFAAMPSVKEIVRRPCMIRNGDDKLHPAPSGAFAGRLFAGHVTPLPEPDPTYPLLRKWLSDIQLLSPKHLGNLMGWTVATYARPELKEFPFLVVDGQDRNVGKSRVAAAVSAFANAGREAVPVTFTGDEHEAEKRFGGLVGKPGPVVIWFDNVRPKRGQSGAIRSQFLAAASTYSSAAIRKNYGKEPEPIYYPLVIFTANEASVENDLHDRTVRVVLSGPGRYFNPDPLRFGEDNYHALLAEALHLLAQIEPRPLTFKPTTRFRDFEWIATEVARRLGLECDFAPDAVDTADNIIRELVSVVADLEEERGGPPTVVDVVQAIVVCESNLPELAGLFRAARTVSDRSRAHALRHFITHKIGSRCLHINNKEVRFTLDKNSAGQYNLSLKK